MTICPIAIAVGCKKCPIFKVCPAKGIIGDYKNEDDAPPKPAPGKTQASTKSTAKNGPKKSARNGAKARAKRAK